MILRAFVVVLALLVGSWLFFQGLVPMLGMEEPERQGWDLRACEDALEVAREQVAQCEREEER